MTRRASALDSIEPEPVASVHPLDLERLGVAPGGTVTIESRRGRISLYARADDGMPRGAIFIPFCYYEAAANMLTNPVLDPFGKIPEFKYCAVKVTEGRPRAGAHELRRRRAAAGARTRAGALGERQASFDGRWRSTPGPLETRKPPQPIGSWLHGRISDIAALSRLARVEALLEPMLQI